MKIGRFFDRDNKLELFGIINGDKVTRIADYNHPDETGEWELAKLEVMTPVMPKKIIAVGLNYRRHAEEMKLAIPDDPVLFLKPHTAALPHKGIIGYPDMSERVDFEAELGIVIAKGGRDIPEADVDKYILGFTAFNDVTARDLQSRDGQWTRAKGFDTFAPFGPYVETDFDPSDVAIAAVLNGKTVQSSRTSDMIFKVPYLVSFISRVMTLEPGDVIATGTPEGIGPMRRGDEITIRIEGLTDLVNYIR
ncbi:MAG: fumarylacetoacetate hydrolase family protein [Brevinematales bacterium]|nr:fumarylacetoacetate hydrolase family protein [Brevinematales bacterium]